MTTAGHRPFVVEESVISVMALAAAASPNETGGLIVGTRTADGVWIAGFVEIEVTRRHRSRFVIPAGATHPVIDKLRLGDTRIGYLGDWHSHPADAGPSRLDFSTLQDLAVGVLGERRLLGLVRRSDSSWDLELWVMNRLRLPRRVDYELTGPIPRP